jgi:hypothetical protein
MDPLPTQVPQDPDSFHQLHWTPGTYGKGVLMPDGALHHWSTGKTLDGAPSHRQYIQQIGQGDIYSDPRRRDAYTMFWIDPEGGFEPLTGHEHTNQIGHIDPRLRQTHDLKTDWKFADARTQQRELDRQNLGPVDFEKKYDWDESLKYDHPEVTEWVPTHELKKFMEYDRRPGQPDSYSTPERWNALTEHIKEHGFGSPAILDFNPDTGMAHMSEGNHRTQIALDSAIPAVPVRVYRSRRTSPTQVPVNPQPQEEWRDHQGEHHWPSDIRPSHIGLPTVPPPGQEPETNWNLGKTASDIRIVQGQTSPEDSPWSEVGRDESHIPALYSEAHGPTIYVGKGGTHHGDLVMEFGLPHHDVNNWAYVRGDVADHGLGFPNAAMVKLLEYLGVDPSGGDGRAKWTF